MARGGKELIRGLCSYGQWGWPRVRSPLNLHIGIILLGCAHCPRLVPLSQSCEASKAPHSRGWVPGRVCLQSMGTAGLCSGGVASGPSTWGGGANVLPVLLPPSLLEAFQSPQRTGILPTSSLSSPLGIPTQLFFPWCA